MSKPSPTIQLRRDTLEWRVLNLIDELGFFMADIWLPKHYSEARLWRTLLGVDRRRTASEKEREKMKLLISSTLGRLKIKGLIKKEDGSTRKAIWKITDAGAKALEHYNIELPPEDGRLRIFVFDIAENRKEDRHWVRASLAAAGYRMLQKSVWIGKRPLPESFLKEVGERDLFEAIHIFEIKEAGTLSNLDWK